MTVNPRSEEQSVYTTDYDAVAGKFDLRYRHFEYRGIQRALKRFLDQRSPTVLEVGCGTGHWLSRMKNSGARAYGLDPSRGMLKQAVVKGCGGAVVGGDALKLPYRDGSFDRIVCVHALHHFPDRARFFAEAMRVLKPGGGLITFDLDPFDPSNVWYVYRFFPQSLEADRRRYASTSRIRSEMAAAGFERIESFEADRFRGSVEAGEALERGMLDRAMTSQLTDLSESEYESGLAGVRREMDRLRPGKLILETDVPDYGTQGWIGT